MQNIKEIQIEYSFSKIKKYKSDYKKRKETIKMRAFLEKYGLAIFTLVIIAIMISIGPVIAKEFQYRTQEQVETISEMSSSYESLGNSEHKTPDGKVEAHDTTTPGETCSKCGEVIKDTKTEKTLIKGSSFRATIPSNVTAIVFTDETASEDVTLTDVSASSDNSIVAWLDGTTYNISSQDENVKIMANWDCAAMFKALSDLVSIDFTNFDTRTAQTMNMMFAGCNRLENIDLSNFDTRSVYNTGDMFNSCTSLRNLDLTNFNTSKITDMQGMFVCCTNLTNLDLSSFDTSNVRFMSRMFNGCTNLTSLDLSSFDTSKVETMYYMFSGCKNLINLNLSNITTNNVTNMSYMFDSCSNLTSLELGNKFDTSNVTDMKAMFYNCSNLTSLNLGNKFNTSSVTNMDLMFSNCSNLGSLSLGNKFDVSNVTDIDMSSMFYICPNLTSITTTQLTKEQLSSLVSSTVTWTIIE